MQIRLRTIVAVLVLAVALAVLGAHFMFPGRVDKIETLVSPVAVVGWNEDGLVLADGRHVKVGGMIELPPHCAALSAATARGVEVAPDGRVFGLLKVIHWCGNDPVRLHIVRIDLCRLLTYLGEGQPENRFVEAKQFRYRARFEQEWDAGDYHSFCSWNEAADLLADKAITRRKGARP